MSNKTDTRKVINNSIWVIISKIVNIIAGFAVSIIVTRYLGAEQKGIMADSSAISTMYGFLAMFGLMDLLIARFSEDYQNSGKIAATGMLLMFCGGAVAFILSVITPILLGHSWEVVLYVFICSTTHLYYFLSVYDYWFYSRANSKLYATIQSIIHIVFLIARIIGVPLKAPLVFFILAVILEDATVKVSALLCYKINKDYFVGPLKFDKGLSIELAKLAVPMILSGFASTIYLKIDQIMIGKMIGHEELGVYSVAVTLAEYWMFAPCALYNSFLPLLAGCQDNEDEFYRKLQYFSDILVAIAYAAIMAVMLFGKMGINLLYGPEFNGTAVVLMIYIWAELFTCLAFPATAVYVINKDTKTVFMVNIVGAGINFVFNIIFIHLYGYIGAAFATLLEYIVVAIGQMVVLKGKYRRLYIAQIKALFPFYRLIRRLKK